ncbi:GTP-binding protein [Spirulina major CS-329]|uniref:GTP-binding protein n=1 Tax=Spirulina TaxID=1154 RepID=UPI0023309BA3|nr:MULTISPECIES: GTP-binding protein [Spirulina]MDB9496024.1 GTP-binding protein [Spirulina subsalsa CS-330]MDB9504457.1 GTP-binding protein [Spirulina major CS-329]
MTDDFDATLLDIAAIQGELHYKQAQTALHNLVQHLDLTPQEEAGLNQELEHLSQVLDKLDRSVVQIAAFGMVGRGKSSILNALLGETAFEVGPLHGVTRTISNAAWTVETDALQVQRVVIPSVRDAQIQLVDTPGIDEVDGQTREQLAKQVAKQADLILFIVSGDMTQVEYNALSQLREVGKPMLLVFNKIDQYPEADRFAIYHKLCDERVRELISPDEVVMVAASPLVAVQVSDRGQTRIERQRGAAQIAPLKVKILDVLHREGKSLLALNTMLYASELNEQVVARKVQIRAERAEQLTWRAVMTKAGAIAINPVTVLDLLTGAAIDVALILSLSKLYGLPMTHGGAVALLRQIALGMGGITLSDVVTTLGLSGLKSVLGITAPLTGGASLAPYLSVAIMQASVAGVMTHAIATITQTYLTNGATWGPDGPKTVIQNILATLDEQSILYRIKTELTAKLHPPIA